MPYDMKQTLLVKLALGFGVGSSKSSQFLSLSLMREHKNPIDSLVHDKEYAETNPMPYTIVSITKTLRWVRNLSPRTYNPS